ncbi:MAG: SH3 domain-containing protein [Candidatus Omnitrophica bacterium]|nr:SH3 domain-containing protein [Candidatus Omnitrophota bacterium]MDD5027312.1 SH3 domain-containing protein [Candidatus Omnitrophota bacterium]MDD5661946.1 SH3 domain-containing protein [Candidatus Omnitrophota bacterium]
MSLKYLIGILCLAAAALAVGFSPAYAGEKVPFLGEINANNINLRLDATATAEVLGTLNKGERVEVIAEFYGWYKVRLPKNVPVYIKKSLAACINHAGERALAEEPLQQQCSSAKVLKDRVNIRSKPSESSGIVGIADKNIVVNVSVDTGSWYGIEPIQNSFGWVYKKFITKAVILPEAAPLSQNKITTPENRPGDTVLIGTVKPYGIVFMRPATHKLISVDDRMFLLKGNRSSLNALNHQKVKVTGKMLNSVKGEYPVVEVKRIEVLS